MAEKKVLVCDVCGADGAESVTIIIGDTAWRADLCREHRQVLEPILTHARQSVLPSKRGSTPYEKVSLEHLMEVIKQEGR